MRKLLVLSAVVLSLSGTAAGASRPDVAERQICAGDVQRLCPDEKPGSGKILICLQSRIDQVSPECRNAMEEAKKKVKAAAEVCRDDARKYCPGVQPGTGRVAKCLKEHIDSLSPDCRKVMEKERSRSR